MERTFCFGVLGLSLVVSGFHLNQPHILIAERGKHHALRMEDDQRVLLQGLRGVNKDIRDVVNTKFSDWLAENGVWTSTTSSWGRARHPLAIASDVKDDDEPCGRGLLAKESIGQGELMLTLPLSLCMTRSTAQKVLGKEVISNVLDEYVSIALLLMHERALGVASQWAPYIEILPATEEIYPSFAWKEQDLDMVRGSPIYAASMSLRAKISREYETLRTTLFPRIPGSAAFTEDWWLWAFAVLFSRAARLPSAQGGEVLALVPYADLLNHSPYSNVYIDCMRSGFPLLQRGEEVALYADRPFKRFEQVFINYGEKSNADLLLLYGFTLDANPFDAVEVTVGLSRDDPLYAQKKAYLEKAGRGATSVRFPLRQGRYPSQLVDLLRLLLAEPADLGLLPLLNADFNSPLTPALEVRVLETIITICESYLAAYPTALEQDEALLKDKVMFAALDRHQRMAVRLRASEKRILLETIAAVNAELRALPADTEDGGGELVEAGRGFDPLLSSAGKGKIQDFVEVKGSPVRQSRR